MFYVIPELLKLLHMYFVINILVVVFCLYYLNKVLADTTFIFIKFPFVVYKVLFAIDKYKMTSKNIRQSTKLRKQNSIKCPINWQYQKGLKSNWCKVSIFSN